MLFYSTLQILRNTNNIDVEEFGEYVWYVATWVFREIDLIRINLSYDLKDNLYIVRIHNQLLSYPINWSKEEIMDVCQEDGNIIGWPINAFFYWNYKTIFIAAGWQKCMSGNYIHGDNLRLLNKIEPEFNDNLEQYFSLTNGYDGKSVKVNRPHGSFQRIERSNHDSNIQISMTVMAQAYLRERGV